MKGLKTYAATALLVFAGISVANAQDGQSCRRSAGRIVGQSLAGLAGAWVGGVGMWTLFDRDDDPNRRVKGDAGYVPNANTAFAAGSWVGATLGVYAAGNRRRQCGRLLSTAVGALVPSIPLFFGRDEPYLPVIGVVIVAPLQSIGGLIGYRVGAGRSR
jgi:hypothetical protein